MEEADKDWLMIRMVDGWMFLLVLAHPGSPGQRAVKWLLLLFWLCIMLWHAALVGWQAGHLVHRTCAIYSTRFSSRTSGRKNSKRNWISQVHLENGH